MNELNIKSHPLDTLIREDLYLIQIELEQLPASIQQTKIAVMLVEFKKELQKLIQTTEGLRT